VITGVFTLAVDRQVFLFIYKVLAVVFRHFEIRQQLDGVGGTGFFAKAAEDAAGKVDAEERRIPSAVRAFCGLQRDAVNRTGGCAEVTSYATFPAVRVTGQRDAPAPAGRQGGF